MMANKIKKANLLSNKHNFKIFFINSLVFIFSLRFIARPVDIFLQIGKIMKINENVRIVGQNVILIPYEEKHVERYHQWMCNKELQELTASEPLTIEEEYEMQKSWRLDDDKCTFLILDKQKFQDTNDEINSLIGDTNLFLQNDEDGELQAEAEIMIADFSAHGKHFGWESMLLMLSYGQAQLNCRKFIAKINMDNTKSIRLFEKMQFVEIGRVEIFKEIEFSRPCTPDWISWLNNNVKYETENYK